MTTAALEAMGAQYPEYAALLEERFLRRLALRREDLEYRSLFEEHVIGPELFGVLQREIQETRAEVLERPRLDLGLETRALIARVPMFAALDRDQLDALSRLLRPQLAVPDERLIKIGAPGDAMYFIASGVLEVMAAGQRILLSRGDFVGEMALVLNQPRQADVTALSYCLLLTLDRRDFQSLLRGNAQLREIIDREATARARMNEGARADGVLR
jgi:CPA1 family monovalent cation:H+ antiporter